MNAQLRFFLLLIAVALAAKPVCAHAQSGGSLFDRSSARTAPMELQTILGPKSGSIRYDARMLRAAELAAERARKHSTSRCWHFVKDALVNAQVIPTRPETAYAKEAGDELRSRYGFVKLKVNDPFQAPIGSVLVYGGPGAGHVELRTRYGFVSDFVSETPSSRPLLGVYVKRT